MTRFGALLDHQLLDLHHGARRAGSGAAKPSHNPAVENRAQGLLRPSRQAHPKKTEDK